MEAPVTTEEAVPAPAPPAHTIVGVRFMPVGKIYHFDATHLRGCARGRLGHGDRPTRGKQMGQVAALQSAQAQRGRRAVQGDRARWPPTAIWR